MQIIVCRGSGDTSVRADPGGVTSPMPRLVFRPCVRRGPVALLPATLSRDEAAERRRAPAHFNAGGPCARIHHHLPRAVLHNWAAKIVCENCFEPHNRIKHLQTVLPPVLVKGEPSPNMNLVDRMNFYKVPGVSIAVIDQGRIVWARGYGFADTAAKRTVTPETRFQGASISKSVAAAGALHFVEEGRIDLDRNVNDYLKSWKVPENDFTRDQKVTLRRILSHSAGLTVHGFPGYEAGKPLPTLVQVLNGEKPANTEPVRVDTVPGTKWRYAGGGYVVMQQMLIDVLGEPFPEMMQRTVLKGFDMKESAYSQPLRDDWKQFAATGYRPDGRPVEDGYHTYPELAAAGLWTTPSDLARFAIGIQNALAGKSHDVISKGMAEQMLTRQIENDGLGVFLDGQGSTLRFSHGGANEGFQCLLVAYAATGQGAAIMTNSDRGGGLIPEIMFAIAHEYGWQDYGPKERSQVKVRAGHSARLRRQLPTRPTLLLGSYLGRQSACHPSHRPAQVPDFPGKQPRFLRQRIRCAANLRT